MRSSKDVYPIASSLKNVHTVYQLGWYQHQQRTSLQNVTHSTSHIMSITFGMKGDVSFWLTEHSNPWSRLLNTTVQGRPDCGYATLTPG